MAGLTRGHNDTRQARLDLAATFRWSCRLGLNEGISNHYSYAVAEDRFLINPWGPHWSELTASSLLLCDLEGRVLEGEGTVEITSLYIHARVHRALKHARAIFHTHMPYATAIASRAQGRLEMVSQNALRFHGTTAYDDGYQGLALDNEEGDRLARAIGPARVLFMANHGVMVAGKTIAQGFDDLYYLEQAAKVQVLAESGGRPLAKIAPDVVERAASQLDYERENAFLHLSAIQRVLDREEPDWSR